MGISEHAGISLYKVPEVKAAEPLGSRGSEGGGNWGWSGENCLRQRERDTCWETIQRSCLVFNGPQRVSKQDCCGNCPGEAGLRGLAA